MALLGTLLMIGAIIVTVVVLADRPLGAEDPPKRRKASEGDIGFIGFLEALGSACDGGGGGGGDG